MGRDVEPGASREGLSSCHRPPGDEFRRHFRDFFGTLGAMTERARPVIGTFGAKLASIYSIF